MALSLKQLNRTPKTDLPSEKRIDLITSKPWGDVKNQIPINNKELTDGLKTLKETLLQKKLSKISSNDDFLDRDSSAANIHIDDFFEDRHVFKRNALGPGARALWCEVLGM